MALSSFDSNQFYVYDQWNPNSGNDTTDAIAKYWMNNQGISQDDLAKWAYNNYGLEGRMRANAGFDEIKNQYNNYLNSINKQREAGKQVLSRDDWNKLNNQVQAGSESARQDIENKQSVASAATQANMNAGINKSLAGMVGEKTAENTTIQPQAYAAQRNQQASTQADYLARMGDIEALDLQAKNAKKAQDASGIGAFLSGAAGGASTGFLISDKRAKEPYHNDKGLPEADADDALRQIESIEYKYKEDTGLDQDKHVGITAQSLIGTPWEGILDHKGEYLALDKQKLLEAVMAGIASLQKQLDEREA